ncbi:hypothetical protein QE363_001770 [Sphingomonas sp. SORGH_AS870]|uniref:hypothetical protein n=1 Tax=Sphingomonas sp. SORGH_AS_0870 TaxID=3041801 RepID=UPI002854728C|nr:hypothetical protein [Sphingomonas sp. SORGH_AS_0870]MDR6145977.1 hypothetical protein [Sphingomonas sp. SORGH_AS_0870]
MSARSRILAHIRDDETNLARFRVELAEAATMRLDIGDWKKFVVLHRLEDWADGRSRFYRSIQWRDSDAEDEVLDSVSRLVEHGDEAVLISTES